jgi:glycosyltransferase involved in cell wall biosynthesis
MSVERSDLIACAGATPTRPLTAPPGRPPLVQGETFVCIATRRWDAMWREAQQHMSRIARHNRVLYFEPGRDPDRPVAAELRRNGPNFLRLRPRRVRENLTVLPTPSSLPYGRQRLPDRLLGLTAPLVAALNARILIWHVRRATVALDVEAPILWLYDPRHVDLIGALGEKLACYYIYDEYADFRENARLSTLIRRYDDRMVRRADAVFACSPWIYRRRREIVDHVYLTPNAVDFEAFHRALAPGLPTPPDLVGLPRPIVGAAGVLDRERIDVELLLRVADAFPNGTVVLVGPDRLGTGEAARRLRARPNVRFLGPKLVDQLPAYVGQFDAALVPYVVAAHTAPLYPLKMFEYLAAGRAVVASALPEIRCLAPVIRVACTPAAFVDAVRGAVVDYAPARVEARLAVARQNTWDEHVGAIYRALAPRLRRAVP